MNKLAAPLITRAPSLSRLLGWLALGSVFVLVLSFASHKIYEADLGFHLRAGQWILDHKQWPRNDTFTYTLSNQLYLDLHWLYQITLAILYNLGKAPALILMHAALIVAAFALAIWVSWTKFQSPLALAGLLLLGVLASELRFMLRPETVTWLLLSLLILILERRAARPSWSGTRVPGFNGDPGRAAGMPMPLWPLPLIHLAWVNIEGLFVLGWVVIGCYLVGSLIEQRRIDRDLAVWGSASVAITLLNPYGLQGVFFPLTLATRLSKENVFGQSISEFVSPWQVNLALPWSAWAYYLLTGLVVIGLSLTWSKRRPREFLLALAFFILSAQAIRNVPLFVLVALPILASCWRDLVPRLTHRPGKKTRRPASRGATPAPLQRYLSAVDWRTFAGGLILLTAIGLTLRVLTNAYYIAARRPNRFGFEISAADLPVKAAAFMHDQNITGRIFNDLANGGYLMWQLPQPVFIDGRLEVMTEEFYREYQTAYQSGGLLPLLKKYDAEVAIFSYQPGVTWVQQLRATPGTPSGSATARAGDDDAPAAPEWRLVYYDDLNVIYTRTDVYPELAEATFPTSSPNALPIPLPPDQRTALLHTPRATKLETWLQGFWQPEDLPRETINRGIFYYYLDKLDLAEAFFLDALQTSRGKYIEVYLNLGNVYYKEKLSDLAAFCYQTALAEKPDIPLAQERLRQLTSP